MITIIRMSSYAMYPGTVMPPQYDSIFIIFISPCTLPIQYVLFVQLRIIWVEKLVINFSLPLNNHFMLFTKNYKKRWFKKLLNRQVIKTSSPGVHQMVFFYSSFSNFSEKIQKSHFISPNNVQEKGIFVYFFLHF